MPAKAGISRRQRYDPGVFRRFIIPATLTLLVAAAQPDPHYPAPSVDTVAPALPAGLRHGVLIFSKTNGFRHVEQIPHATQVIAGIARAQRRAPFRTENAAVFTDAALARFDVVVLASSSGNVFTDSQRAAFRRFVARGGGVVALHAAGGDPSYDWRWYLDHIVGALFIGHPGGADQFQPARVLIDRPDHPVMRGIAPGWTPVDEWYSFDRAPSAPGWRILARIDEASYRPDPKQHMGAVHPIVWTNESGPARILYSAIGHRAQAYDDPRHRRLIANAIRWAARK